MAWFNQWFDKWYNTWFTQSEEPDIIYTYINVGHYVVNKYITCGGVDIVNKYVNTGYKTL